MAINYYSAINLNQNELQFPVIHSAGSAPSSPSAVAGQLYFNSGNAKALYVYDGSNWLTVGQNSISTLAVETTIASGDKLAFSDESQTGDINNALTVDNLFGTGLQHVTETAIADGDYMLFLDGGATGTAKKEAVADIASLFAGAGMTATNSVMNVIGGDGITANANDVAITAAQTTITSIKNASLTIGADANELIKFGTDAQIIFRVAGGDNVIMKASGEIEATSLDISGNADIDGTLEADAITVNGTALNTVIAGVTVTNATTAAVATTVTITDNESTDEDNPIVFVAGADADGGNLGLETDGTAHYNPSTGKITATAFAGNLTGNVAGNVTGNLTIGGHEMADVDIGSEFNDVDDHLMSSGAIKEKIEGYSYITASSSDTLSNKTIAASQVTEISNITAAEGAQIENIGSTTISATQWGYLGAASGAITNTDVDVSVANLKTALADGFPSNAATIGDADDTITFANDVVISGDLNVTGDTVTTTTTTITTQDPIIRLANNNAADTIDIGFYGTYVATVDGASATRYTGLFRDADEDTDSWTIFKDLTAEPTTTVNTAHSSYSLGDLKLGTLKATTITGALTGNVTGNASGTAATVTTAAQPNITSLGTLTTLTVDNVIVNGTTIGHTGLTDALTFASSGDIITVKDGAYDFNIASHDGTNGLALAGTVVTATAAELNLLDGVSGLAQADFTKLAAVDATATEIDMLDAGTSGSSVTLASGDSIIIGDASASNETKKALMSDVLTFVGGSVTATGALNSGSITSGFGNIDNGSSTITTTGLISGGSLDIDDVLINGATIGHTDDTDLITLSDGVVTVAGELDAASLDISGNADIDGTLETDALTINGTAIVAQATASAVGGVELATAAEVITGTDAARVVTADTLSAKSVVCDIDVSSLTDANIVTITHNLGTADILVQVYDKTTEANIMCDIARTTDDFSTASTSVVSIDFGTAPPNDCRALITSLAGATAGSIAYT